MGASTIVTARPDAMCLHCISDKIQEELTHLPFKMAMEEPDARVVGHETENHVSVWSDEDGIATHGDSRECDVVGVVAFVICRAGDDLEVMSVKMERMLSWIEVVENNINNFILLQYKSM